MTIGGALLHLQGILLGLPGVNSAPDFPSESVGSYPFAVSYEYGGYVETHSAYFADVISTVFCEVHVSRTMLDSGISTAISIRNSFLQALISDPTLGGEVDGLIDIKFEFGLLSWGSVTSIGYRFKIDLKIQI